MTDFPAIIIRSSSANHVLATKRLWDIRIEKVTFSLVVTYEFFLDLKSVLSIFKIAQLFCNLTNFYLLWFSKFQWWTLLMWPPCRYHDHTYSSKFHYYLINWHERFFLSPLVYLPLYTNQNDFSLDESYIINFE